MNEFLQDDSWLQWGLHQPWFAWGLGILVLFPLLIVVLGEVLNYFERSGSPYVRFFRTLRHIVLPQMVFLVLLTRVFEFEPTSTSVRMVETLLYVLIIHAGLMLVDTVLFHDGDPKGWRAKVPKLIADIARAMLILLGTAIVLSNVWGFDLGRLLAALGVGSIVLGLALQDTLGSLFSGFALLSSKQFSVGDWLAIGEHEGKIVSMNWRTVTLLTRDEDIIIVPNSDLAKSNFLNYSHPYPRHMERIPFDISFEDAPHKVKRILTTAARETPGVLENPPPNCALVSFDEFSIRHELQYFIADYADQPRIRDDFMSRVWYMARREGMTFPTRAHEIVMTKAENLENDNSRDQCEKILRGSALLSGRYREVLEVMATQGRILEFGKNERIVCQDEPPSHLYVVASGQGLVRYTDIDGTVHEICRLDKGDFFGISELVRHEPSEVDVIAATDLDLVGLDQAVTHDLYEKYPEFSVELSRLIANRHRSIQTIKRNHQLAVDDWLEKERPSIHEQETQIIALDSLRRERKKA